MSIYNNIIGTRLRGSIRMLLLLMLLLLTMTAAEAQIKIGGSIYGGGNEGDVGGSTSVTVRAGDLNRVYGGARMADIAGNAFVNIDGEHASNYILINYVYGGNDIAGSIGTSTSIPTGIPVNEATENSVDNSWNAFVRISDNSAHTQKTYIGQLFGGGNGDYTYSDRKENGKYDITLDGKTYEDLVKPELPKTFLDIHGGSIVYAYGGGNNATVSERTVICVNNPSTVVSSIKVKDGEVDESNGVEQLTTTRFKNDMGINIGFSYPNSSAYQIGSFFGGNNKAEMTIRPTWNLIGGSIRNLYSGGNRGPMTHREGLLLEIPEESTIEVDNVYGGCRMADVNPKNGNTEVALKDIKLTDTDDKGNLKYKFPAGLSARLIIRGGKINNVYGGNDITGNVRGGNAVGVYTSISGDVYGGGNGSYPYTDNPKLKDDDIYGDLYYGTSDNGFATEVQSVAALNNFRPNAEQVSIRVVGKKDKTTGKYTKTIIGGGIYLGGNCATLKNTTSNIAEPIMELKIGSYAYADKVFLGNNGEDMIKTNERVEENGVLKEQEGVLRTFTREDIASDGSRFSSLHLTNKSLFELFMDGCAMTNPPKVVFDDETVRDDPDTYEPYTSYVGSFYCGGNVGSMKINGLIPIDFDHEIVIFDKLVGGCNDAYVRETAYNAAFEGGIIGTKGANGDKLKLNLSGLKVEPKRWKMIIENGEEVKYINPETKQPELEWNTWIGNNKNIIDPLTAATGTASEDDMNRRLKGGNIYGGCCESGVVDGNVIININSTIMERDKMFDDVAPFAGDDEDHYYNHQSYTIQQRHTGVILGQQGMDPLGTSLNVFGGGKGIRTEIWGSTTINMNKGYVFQVFGGSEEGVIGKPDADGDYTFNGKKYKQNDAYSCYVNLKGSAAGVTKKDAYIENMPESEFIYGGGFEGPIAGNAVVRLGNGRIFNSFTGSCDADILGHTETYIGYRHDVEDNSHTVTGQVDGFPWIRDIVYGGNDLGGEIKGFKDYKTTTGENAVRYVREETDGKRHNEDVLKAASYVEYRQGRADAIFGGHYGTYDYVNVYPRELNKKPYMANAFVNFRPSNIGDFKNKESNVVKLVYGGSQGYMGDFDSNKMQERSYVLIDIPQDMENYKKMRVFGAGAWGGLGMMTKVESSKPDADRDKVSAIIDLVRGQIDAVYGGSYKTGFTRRTVVNVKNGSTIRLNSIFGGACGLDNNLKRCDVYESNVNYSSDDAIVTKAIYGGNNAYRRTLYSRVNINSKVNTGVNDNNGVSQLASVFGAGCGAGTWSQYTEVNLNENARVKEVYGGAEAGMVVNKATIDQWKAETAADAPHKGWNFDMGEGETAYTDLGLDDPLVKSNPLGDASKTEKTGKFNTNVYINDGALVDVRLITQSWGPSYDGGYAYAGGYGDSNIDGSGDVYGTTYIGLFGGEVKKDIYAGGTVGSVMNRYEPKDNTSFKAIAYAYIEGGTARNVYGGGWKGSVGMHKGESVRFEEVNEEGQTVITHKYIPSAGEDLSKDVLGESYVVIGIRADQVAANLPEGGLSYKKGIPAIQRNAYSGGEGGAIFGTANLLINNGHIGYVFEDKEGVTYSSYSDHYKEKLDDETQSDGIGKDRLEDCGNAYGGGYDDLSSVDYTNVRMYGGRVRNSLYGGGEIATIGRGTTKQKTGKIRELNTIYMPGKTHVEMYNGHVLRDVFGGGKGYNKLKFGLGNELYTDGYVFGKTEVFIHGGEIGTEEGLAKEYGNVFGAGNIGYVYSSGYQYSKEQNKGTGSPGHIYYYDNTSAHALTEDCKVVVAPYLQVKPGVTVTVPNDRTYQPYEYVPTDYLNTLGKKTNVTSAQGVITKEWPAAWDKLITEETVDGKEVDRGVIIHNAVFGGGNVSSNSDKTYANATTVYGNVTATLYDVYHRDFITIGTEHTGGLYGGGNFTMVDGYRELNITNYGTDYFSLDQEIDLPTYRTLSNRERAYFKLKYRLNRASAQFTNGDLTSKTYTNEKLIEEDEYLKLVKLYDTETNHQVEDAFTPWGICSIYAGRLLNTIQRADLCGVFGSRMVLQGAKDRVADTEQNTDFTINRVGELSLNKKRSVISGEAEEDAEHGNYFGIYSVVNCLGNLTSDQHFDDNYIRPDKTVDNNQTYYSYKSTTSTGSGNRNKGRSPHQVALASGVHLELTTEKSTADHKDYGYITGVVELDLINVKKDKVMGGGFVYAKNEHRVPKYYPNKTNVILSTYNKMPLGNNKFDEAITYKRFRYSDSDEGEWPESDVRSISGNMADYGDDPKSWQTSGNFIHHEKPIVDDCYPINNAYDKNKTPYSEAHYWYVKGEVYVYDQIITAYTGSATAYHKESQLNLTITAASNGKLQLLNVKPNLYAYKMPIKGDNNVITVHKIGTVKDDDDKPIDQVTVNNEHDSYKLNDVITWWDWHQLPDDERAYFVTETYTNCVDCKIDGTLYKAGTYVMDETDFNAFKSSSHTICNTEDMPFEDDNHQDIGLSYVFRSSNNIGHDTGYVLTFDMSTPSTWSKYYTTNSHADQETITKLAYDEKSSADQAAYREAPTFYPVTSGVYGQHNYSVGDIITESVVNAYASGSGTATVEPAYVAVKKVTYTYKDASNVSHTTTANAGSAIPESVFNSITKADTEEQENVAKTSVFEAAKVCINTVKLAEGTHLGNGDLKSQSQIDALKLQYGGAVGAEDENTKLKDDIDAAMKVAYICSTAGSYGGQQFDNTTNYGAIDAWCALPEEDRMNNDGTYKFIFNKDALDLLGAPDYVKVAGTGTANYYEDDAIQNPDPDITKSAFGNVYGEVQQVDYTAIKDNVSISNTDFEALRNDRRHYTRVELDDPQTVYIATANFTYDGVPYGKGQIVDDDVWNENRSKVVDKQFGAGIHYYRYEAYDEDPYKNTEGTENGLVISEEQYKGSTSLLVNNQEGYVIQGKEPVETTTLYVSSQSDIYDVSKEKVITVIYQYTYYENEDNDNIKFTNELHVVNVHIQMESGVPIIGPLTEPDIVIPGNAVNMNVPDVTIGSYPPLGNGWEIFNGKDDALMHRNGEPYENGVTPLYWYQNGDYYINYYSKNYLGKMYAPNPMPLKVANYHDLDAVMNDKDHHMYVDRPDVDRASKIYIDNRTCESDADKNELDLLKDFFDLSVQTAKATTGETKDHELLDNHVHGARNLEFILQSDMSPKKYATTWNSIGGNNTIDNPNTDEDEAITGNGQCFEGILHGDGHTISGLSHSLFAHLCGEVYNLGVTGTFTTSGIADEGSGYLENCWIKSDNNTAKPETVKPVFGTPTNATPKTGETARTIHIVNCYYPKENQYTAHAAESTYGLPTEKPLKAFYNGEVAYDLNGFYLFKRYCDTKTLSGDRYKYSYLKDVEGTLTKLDGYYEDNLTIDGRTGPYLFNNTDGNSYVEERYANGDFVYAGGRIPSAENERFYVDPNDADDEGHYYPIWPDDYIFFGQALNYDKVEDLTHQDKPSSINRRGGRIQTDEEGNRVYRAPAYFGDNKMDVAHFNQYAVFAKEGFEKGMTAIDFSGGNGDVKGGYQYGVIAASGSQPAKFYPPLLDDDGLKGFTNADMTRNLLVYTGISAPASSVTNTLIQGKLTDEAYAEINSDYHTVGEAANLRQEQTVRGHWVQKSGDSYETDNYVATRDHFLVDKEAFNAPISYTFDTYEEGGETRGYRMWYQRLPENYVGKKKVDGSGFIDNGAGWDGISLPFMAEIVTTDMKGEITHFYKEGDNWKGHEYWLREYNGGSKKEGNSDIFVATFEKPDPGSTSKTYYNTFLWNYYYKNNDYNDINSDKYPGIYYSESHEYLKYPRLANGTPYIIGFPGERYYEFDLSGNFIAKTAKATAPAKLSAQIITFASAPGTTIGVSDTELASGKKTKGGYTFVPNYGNETLSSTAYILNADHANVDLRGSSYDKVASDAVTVPFRPYFTGGSDPARELTRSIIFSNEQTQLQGDENREKADEAYGLSIYAKRKKIVVESNLREITEVRIVNTAGITINTFEIEPGETITTQVNNSGVYIVQTADARYTKKLAVR